ncbi:MAG: 4Fe-4S dicluster domain-containing protein [Deltaproteobacteria bacterium]|nr:4Fe-4S dicluster domain-containing protein [Deltaproteobacteria bacterium]
MQLGFFFDQSRCGGCYACVVACKDWNDIPAGPVFWRRVAKIERGRFPQVEVAFFSGSCYHCTAPLCLQACPSGAIRKEENGIVQVDREVCWGREECGGACAIACPYMAPQFGPEPGAKMQKCTLCAERWAQGKKPICVQACPLRALDAGPMDELERRYGEYGRVREVEGFALNGSCRPSIIFKKKG